MKAAEKVRQHQPGLTHTRWHQQTGGAEVDSSHRPDDRTREQHLADVANSAIATIGELILLSNRLSAQVTILENRGTSIPENLSIVRGASPNLVAARESLRDIAATLPIRGIDFGDGA